MSITCEEVWLSQQGVCARCAQKFNPYWDYLDNGDMCEEPYRMKLCPGCYEDGLEEFEEQRRERISRENEY